MWFAKYLFMVMVCTYQSLEASEVVRRHTSVAKHDLDVAVENFWDWRLYESPEYASKYGINVHQDRLEEFTEEAFTRQKENATAQLQELQEIDRSELDRQRNFSCSILQDLLKTYIEGYEHRKIGMYNYLTSNIDILSDWYRLVNWMKLQNEADFKNLLLRYRALPTQIDQIITLMRMAIASRTTRHKVALTGVVERLDKEIATSVNESRFYAPFNKLPDTISEEAKKDLPNEAETILTEKVRPAWAKLKEFVIKEYLPNTAAEYGVGSLPGGQAFYQAVLKWHTSVDMTPQQVHDLGLKEVDRIEKLMKMEMKRYDFEGSIQDYVQLLRNDSNNFYKTKEELMDGYRAIVKKAHEKLPIIMSNIPEQNTILVAGAGSFLGFYSDPALDGSRPGRFLVSVSDPETKLKSDMYALALHEAEPGHHTQAYVAIESSIPAFRRAIEFRKYFAAPFNWLFHTAYVEGWALYAEYLGEEMGMYSEPNALYGRYASEMFRATRLVVDTGIHSLGWSKQRAQDYLANYTTLPEKGIEREVRRYISWPGQACSYKIGGMEFKRLREQAEEELGSKFDLRSFHDTILRQGPAPLYIVGEEVDAWVQAVKDEDTSSGSSLRAVQATLVAPLIAACLATSRLL